MRDIGAQPLSVSVILLRYWAARLSVKMRSTGLAGTYIPSLVWLSLHSSIAHHIYLPDCQKTPMHGMRRVSNLTLRAATGTSGQFL